MGGKLYFIFRYFPPVLHFHILAHTYYNIKVFRAVLLLRKITISGILKCNGF